MKPMRLLLFAAPLLLLLIAACAPQLPSGTGALPTTQGTTDPAVPVTGATSPVSGQSLSAAHPAMQVGSIDRYFDGALLDAVPDNGTFLMGAAAPYNTQRPVRVSDFWIYSTKVSNQMYAWCVSLGKCTAPNATDNYNFRGPKFANYPVVGVTWQQASDYCSFANGRLPTEAEWEKVASWDDTLKQKRLYPWGSADPSCSLLNYKYCLGKSSSVIAFGQGSSYYGAYDMEGNVYEWVGDWFQSNLAAAPTTDPTGPATGTRRVIRSSAYDSDAAFALPTARFSDGPATHRANLGFRCVVKDPAYFAPFCSLPVSYGVDVSTNGASTKPCPDPLVVRSAACSSGNKPVEIVTVRTNPQTIVNVTGLDKCNPANNDVGVPHQCDPNITVQVNAGCAVVPGGAAACPPNFMADPKNPNQCVSAGGPGTCPAGFAYNSAVQCCSAVPGIPASAPLCAVGQHPFGSVCVNDYGGPQPPASVTFVTDGVSCVLTPGATGGSPLIPVPGSTNPPGPTLVPVNPPPATQPPPATEPPPSGGGGGGGKCDLKPKDCPFGLDRQSCTCNSNP